MCKELFYYCGSHNHLLLLYNYLNLRRITLISLHIWVSRCRSHTGCIRGVEVCENNLQTAHPGYDTPSIFARSARRNYSTVSSFPCYILSDNCFVEYGCSFVLEQRVLPIINDCPLLGKTQLLQWIRKSGKLFFPALSCYTEEQSYAHRTL